MQAYEVGCHRYCHTDTKYSQHCKKETDALCNDNLRTVVGNYIESLNRAVAVAFTSDSNLNISAFR
jgi:hypothetical protein